MTDRENKLRSLLERVRANRAAGRPVARTEVDARAGSSSSARVSHSSRPAPPIVAAQPPSPTRAQPMSFRGSALDGSTRYSSKSPSVERPLSSPPPVEPDSIRPESVAPSAQDVVQFTEAPEVPRPRTFGELLELTLSLRPH